MKLSEGTVKTFVNGGHVKPPFILQLLGHEKIGIFKREQYSLILSDGVDSDLFAILSIRLNAMVHRGDLADNAVVCINDYIVTNLSGGHGGRFKMLNITSMEVVAPASRRIGNPRFARWRNSVQKPKGEDLLDDLPQLTKGALSAIVDKGDNVDSPILQILGNKKCPGKDPRYRLLLSDGVNAYSQAVLDLELLHMFHDGDLSDYSIICIKKYVTPSVPSPIPGEAICVIIILDLEVLVASSEEPDLRKIGDPKPMEIEMKCDSVVQLSGSSGSSSNQVPCGGRATYRAPCACSGCWERNRPFKEKALQLLGQLGQLRDAVLPLNAEDWAAPLALTRCRGGELRLDCPPPTLTP